MPLTAAQAMTQFVQTISPTDVQQAEIIRKRSKTEEYLRSAFPSTSDLPLKRVILIGSADRGTLIRPVDDIDVMAQFTNKDDVFEKYRTDSGAFLQRIRRALDAKTSIKVIGARGQAVRLFYTSGAHVDIAPTFKWSGGGYALPSGDGRWITTDPEAQATWYSQRRLLVGSGLTPLVKLAKRWNTVHTDRLNLSYHLEVVVSTTFKTIGSNYRNALKCLFDWAPGNLAVNDPAGHSGRLDSYLSTSDRSATISRLGQALSRAQLALNAEEAGNRGEAIVADRARRRVSYELERRARFGTSSPAASTCGIAQLF